MEQTPVSPRFTGLLGFNAGYVDTAGFLALNGLFTAHVTGNFVTLGAAFVHGTTGAFAKLLALPLFCAVVVLTRLFASGFAAADTAMSKLMCAKVLLLAAAAAVLIAYGPFPDSDAPVAVIGGMLLVAAMGIQNAIQRMHLGSAPPSTLMTGTTTQVMIDLADLCKGVSGEARTAAVGRLRKMLPALAAFASGCAIAALLYWASLMWCFILPPIVAALATLGIKRAPTDPT